MNRTPLHLIFLSTIFIVLAACGAASPAPATGAIGCTTDDVPTNVCGAVTLRTPERPEPGSWMTGGATRVLSGGDMEELDGAMLAVFTVDGSDEALALTVNLSRERLEQPAYIVDFGAGEARDIDGASVSYDGDTTVLTATGHNARIPFSLINSGSTTIDVNAAGDTATLTGTLGARAYFQVLDLPSSVTTLVLQDVPGSIDDEINMQTGTLIHDRGYTVRVPANSTIASGGVDLLAAGVTRVIEDGATVGVHSWSDGSRDGASYACTDRAHHAQLCYFDTVMGRDAGTAFYFYTLGAAPGERIHNMTRDEMRTYGLLMP